MPAADPFDPLHGLGVTREQFVGRVVSAFTSQSSVRFEDVPDAAGEGIYMLHYGGDFPAYEVLSAAESAGMPHPIYVGRADGGGSRKGVRGAASSPLTGRLRDHHRSLLGVENLNADHFTVRFLPLTEGWSAFCEAVAIAHFQPVWNRVLDGFGNHVVGKNRTDSSASRWDTVHPGRKGSRGGGSQHDVDALLEQVHDHLLGTVDGSTPYAGKLIFPNGVQQSLFG